MRLVLGAVCLTATVLAGIDPQAVPRKGQAAVPLSILFVGNSLTAANDLPGVVEALGKVVNPPVHLTCRTVARSGFSLEDHWKDGDALRALRERQWTDVVLQQGPSSLPASRQLLREYVGRFAVEAGKQGTAVTLYSVWPPRDRRHVFDDVTASYSAAASDVNARNAPVGEAWRAAWGRDPSLALYAEDQFHPSVAGTYLAALTLFARLSGRIVSPLPAAARFAHPALRSLRVTDEQLAVLHAAAADAVGQDAR